MIDRKRYRIPAAVVISVALNGIGFAAIMKLTEFKNPEPDVRITVHLQSPARVILPAKPRLIQPDAKPVAPAPKQDRMASRPASSKPVAARTPALPQRIVSSAVPGAPVQGYSPVGNGNGNGNPATGSDSTGFAANNGVEPGVPPGPPAPPVAPPPVEQRHEDVKPQPAKPPVEKEPAIIKPAPVGEKRPARAVKTAQPAYPNDARMDGVEGTVVLSVSLDPGGSVTSVDIIGSSGDKRLDRAAEKSVKTWSFEPALDDGRPIASRITVRVKFSLE